MLIPEGNKDTTCCNRAPLNLVLFLISYALIFGGIATGNIGIIIVGLIILII